VTPEGGGEPGRGRRLQLIHTPVDSAKVREPVTILTELPPMIEVDRVVIYFRKAGEKNFRDLEMEGQGEAYVTKIPSRYITSTSLQYYIEAHKGTGRRSLVATSGTKTTPHIIVIEGGRAPTIGPKREIVIYSPYRKWLWISAATTAALIGGGVAWAILAGDRASAMEKWVDQQSCDERCQEGLGEPTKPFDDRARDWESEGKTFAVLGKVFLGLGIAAAGATGYIWYKNREYVARERRRLEADSGGVSFAGAPWAGRGTIGVVGRFTF
jgi:hypothetical protein